MRRVEVITSVQRRRRWSATEKHQLIAASLPGAPGVRKIAERFGVDPSTVQRISRPFGDEAARVA
jgi:transposase